ncbi:unnamed protein product [Linum tenue]|uniref:Uncharacterized protein n=1 Tax=Linum tenue TaxID=586396 RepID=A0AAV0H5K1_9ROSI|nr:unnamed protein product [Linum tenue]
MSVVGFDIGNDNCVITVVKQQGIDVLLNDESNRETPTVVCFGEKQRFFRSSGASSAMMNPRSTVTQVKRLIGRRLKDPEVQTNLKTLPFETSEAKDGGILVNLKYLGETHSFAPVQILAMLFSHLKDVAEKNLEMPVVDYVIGIPSYFTDLQRRAYLDAAKIAGLKPLRLMHDCAATALSYGIYKTDFSSTGPTYVAFIDIGHCDTQVQESNPFSVGFSSDEGPICTPSSNGILFPRGLSIPSTKVLTFQRSSQFHLDAFYADPNELPAGVSSRICTFTIGPLQGSSNDKARVKVKVQLNLHGIIAIESATVVSGHGDDFSMHSPSSESSADGSRDRGNRRINIPVSETVYGGMTMAQLSEAHERELELTQQDRIVEQAKEKKNALESYVYEMHNKLFNTLRSFASDEEREGISRSLQETEEWLYGDGDDETENAYTTKMQDLKQMMNECHKA